ncbi:MAG: hypothetical protein WCJ69_00420 [Betaproteobacteria bacterium]
MILTRLALTILTLVSSLFSFAAYTLLLKNLGASQRVDALFYAASVPLSVAGVTSGVLLYLLPPRLIQVNKSVQDATIQSLGLVVFGVCGVASAFALVMWLSGHEARFWLIWLAFANTAAMLLLTTLASCLAQARGAYVSTAVPPLLTSSGLLLGALGAVGTQIEWLLVAGQWTGSAVGLWWVARALHIRSYRSISRGFRRSWVTLTPLRTHGISIALGTSAFTLLQPIDAALCTQLGGGSVSIMSYAQRVLVAVGTAISLGAYTLSAQTSNDAIRAGGHAGLCQQANKETSRVVAFGLIAWVLYQAGGSRVLAMLLSAATMSGIDLMRLLDCIGWMLLGVGPMAAMPYLFRVFYAMGAYAKPAVLGVCTVALYAVLAWLLLGRFEIHAMAYAYGAVWWVVLLAALIWLNNVPAEMPESR